MAPIAALLLVSGGCGAATTPTVFSSQQSNPDFVGTSVAPQSPVASSASRSASRPVLDAPPASFLISPVTVNGSIVPMHRDWPGSSEAILIAVNRLFGSTLGAVDNENRVMVSSSPPTAMENIQLSRGGGRLAYLVLEGIDPGKNFIETASLPTDKTQRIKPQKGFAILGFTLEAGGRSLAFTEVSLTGSSSRQLSWRLLVVPINRDAARTILVSDMVPELAEVAPLPFAWSVSTGEVYLAAIRPFRGGGGRGVWAIRPDGSGLRQVMPETSFVGSPVLSPDGTRFAYLASDLEALPAGYVPGIGEPPGNVMLARDLKTGQEQVVAKEKDRAFGPISWSRSGEAIVTTRREWASDSFQDTAILRLPVRGSVEPEILVLPQPLEITDILETRVGQALLSVAVDKKGASLMVNKASGPASPLLVVPDARIRIIGHLD